MTEGKVGKENFLTSVNMREFSRIYEHEHEQYNSITWYVGYSKP